jgi:hypothetical protein
MDAVSTHAIEKLQEQTGTSFEDMLARMRDHFKPVDPIEDELVKRIARCLWRLTLGTAMEDRLLQRRPLTGRPSISHDRVLKYERLVDIHLHRSMEALERKRERQNNPIPRNELPPRSA